MKSRKFKKGQTMVEYIIIVALIAISLIAVFTYFGRGVGKKVAGATAAISEERAPRPSRPWRSSTRTRSSASARTDSPCGRLGPWRA